MRKVGEYNVGEVAPCWFAISRQQKRGDGVVIWEFLHLVRLKKDKTVPEQNLVPVGGRYVYTWRAFPSIYYGQEQVELALERLAKYGSFPIGDTGRDYSQDDGYGE